MDRTSQRKSGTVETASPEEVFSVITGASSQDPAQVTVSSERLKVLLGYFGTYDALHEIAAQKSVPLPVRQQSIIQFKNAALSHWRSRKLLSDEQRVRIRARCMSFFDEEDDTIAECNQVIVGKIARADFPVNWQSLLTDIMQVVEANLQRCGSSDVDARSSLMLRRSLKLLNAVLKEFASMKMLTGTGTMTNIVNQLHGVIFTYYAQLSSTITSITPPDLQHQRTLDNLTAAHLVFKNLVTMATWLWGQLTNQKPEATKMEPWFQQLFQSSAAQLKTISELRVNLLLALQSSPASSPIVDKSVDQLTRHVRLFGKFFRRLQQIDSAKFVKLPTCNDLILYYWSKVVQATNGQSDYIQDSSTAVFPVRFLVQAMVLFKDNLAKWTPFRKGGAPSETTLSQQFVEDAVKLLITRFIPLNPSDLEGWMSDPEEWVNEEDKETEQWEFELRPCGERVLMTLSLQYRDYVTPLLETTFKQIIALPTSDLASVIQKEALYCAIGRCAPRLKEVIPFNAWLSHNLINEARETNPNFPIIKRRIAWLIGKWVGDACSPAKDPNIWEVLVHLLHDRGPGTDSVVRLTSATAIRECVDTIDFDVDVFAPYLPTVATELVRLMTEADTTDIKRRLAQSLSVVIERVGTKIVPHAEMIAGAIPALWTAAGQEWLFKSELLVVVSSLVSATKEQSASLSALVVPLIRESLTTEAVKNLDDDALELWISALRHTTTLQSAAGQPALLDLFPIGVSLLAENLDLLGKVVTIIEAYIFVDASLVLQHFSGDLLRAFVAALKQAVSTNTKAILVTLGFMTQLAPPLLWGEAMHVSGLFDHILGVLGKDESHTLTLTECVYLMSRIVLADCQMFLQLVSAAAQAKNVPEASLFEIILDQWWRQFDHMSEPRYRKLVSLGMASLVSTGRPEVLERIPNEISNMWIDVLYEIKESFRVPDSGRDSPLERHWDLDDVPTSYYNDSEGTLEYDRRKALLDRDPVRTLQLSSAITGSLQRAEIACGGPHVFQTQYLDKLDPTVLKQLQDELRG